MSITLDQVTKRYQGAPVVNDVSIDIGDGEFFVLLGPSGSGKTTLLRAIAGLAGVDHGRIALHGRDVTHLSARQRGVGLVFQNYALFRHMTVGENIEFALRVRRMPAAARRARRAELLRLVSLEGLDERLPAQLSGGQQQRVAVARALAHKPEVLLLDEPFGALDAKIREELRRTIRQVQRELGITTVLVTHDQQEAFALADRIGVMNLGRLLEMGRPHELYTRPATRFVATFLGAANLILARKSRDGLLFGDKTIAIPGEAPAGSLFRSSREHEVVAVVRPEELEVAPARPGLRSDYLGQAVVEEVLFTGALERMRVRLEERALAGLTYTNGAGEALLDITRTLHEQRAFQVAPGQTVALGVRRAHVLPTPLSSFTACARSPLAAEVLSRQPLLAELGSRMKTRIALRVEPQLGWPGAPREAAAQYPGTTVIPAQQEAVIHVQWLLARGAEEVLVLPQHAASPQRVLIHWADEPVRRATLAVSASVLRHVSAEAVYLGFQSPTDLRPNIMRALLDARSEAQVVHGLEMRTELSSGEVEGELARRLAEAPGQMLILGVCNPAQLEARFGRLLTAGRWPVLIVHRDPLAAPASSRIALAQSLS
jgi:sulfate transport system ATP-binding protein